MMPMMAGHLQYDLVMQLSQVEKVVLTPLTSEVTLSTSELMVCRAQRETMAAMLACGFVNRSSQLR